MWSINSSIQSILTLVFGKIWMTHKLTSKVIFFLFFSLYQTYPAMELLEKIYFTLSHNFFRSVSNGQKNISPKKTFICSFFFTSKMMCCHNQIFELEFACVKKFVYNLRLPT